MTALLHFNSCVLFLGWLLKKVLRSSVYFKYFFSTSTTKLNSNHIFSASSSKKTWWSSMMVGFKCMRVSRKWEKHVVSYAFINFTRLQKKVSSCNSLIQQCHTKENKVLHKLSKSNWISWVSNCIFFVSIFEVYLLYFYFILNRLWV